MNGLKVISKDAIDRALSLAERYRLLNEPEQAASICRDVLIAEATHQLALRTLLLAITDQFTGTQGIPRVEAEALLAKLDSDYERVYFAGVIAERWGRAVLKSGAPAHAAGEWIRKAMSLFADAERVRPEGDDSALLRWNACTRLLSQHPAMDQELIESPLGD